MSKQKPSFVALKPSSKKMLEQMRRDGAAVVAEVENALACAAQAKKVQVVSGAQMSMGAVSR